MNKQYGWVSEYRRKKFFEGQKERKEKAIAKHYAETDIFEIPKTIAVMLDLEGTCDNIDDKKAKIFLTQIDLLRKKFSAQTATISISTHYHDANRMKEILEILSRNLPNSIKIGLNFYFGGIYNHEKGEKIPQADTFNYDKVGTFTSYYVNNLGSNNQWFAIIDDGLLDDIYKKFKDYHPMLAVRPSATDERDIARNNFMSISSMTKGIDGVIEILDTYIRSIKYLNRGQIMETQRNMITHLSSWDLVEKIKKRDYVYLERYFKEGYADVSDYSDTLDWLFYTNINQIPSKDELVHLRAIFSLMQKHFQTINEPDNIDKILKLQNIFETPSN